jgi:hypothetical protein
MGQEFKGRIIYSENYINTINSLKLINSSQASSVSVRKALDQEVGDDSNSELGIIKGYGSIKKINLEKFKRKNHFMPLSAYDESILELNSLEGKVRCISHSTVIQTMSEYIPSAFVTLKFFTKSKIIDANSTQYSDIIKTDDISKSINQEYVNERKYFLSQAAPDNSLIFIDGSLFSGASTNGNFQLVDDLRSKNCLPVFFVKNSESTIITERYDFAKGYNSDLHWAYSNLKEGEVSPVFSYLSPDYRGKAMCFMKVYKNRSPIRIEFPLNFFLENLYSDEIFDLIYYQYLANGNASNVQPRIIEVAEMYAREVLKSTNLYQEIEKMGLTKSMNEERGF